MKFLATLLVSVALSVSPIKAQEPSAAKHEGAESDYIGWKWANFIVLAGALGYFGSKSAKVYFGNRRQQITAELADAERRSAEADRRMAEVDARLANLDTEIANLRKQALLEQTQHTELINQRGALEAERVRTNAAQQIEALSKKTQRELEQHISRLALGLAEERLRSRMTPATQHSLTAAFVQNLKA